MLARTGAGVALVLIAMAAGLAISIAEGSRRKDR